MKAYIWKPRFTRIDMKGATLRIVDGTTPTPNEMTVKFGEGNFTWTERKNIEYHLDRGKLDDVREGDEVPCEISFEGVWEYISGPGGGPPTIPEALDQIGDASLWLSTDDDPCRPYAVDLILLYVPPNCTTEDQETITFADFRREELSYDLREGTISVTGRANILRPTAVRAPQP